jgi:iron-sulfur cluster repair protein YtfE (RIC family)
LELVTADHRQIDEYLRALRWCPSGPERTCLVTELNALLIIHLQVEEATLHPMMRDLMGSSQEEESDVEHELIRSVLAQATQLVDAPGFRCAIEVLSAGVRHHVDDEEQIVLPTLLGQLTLHERSALGTAMCDARRDPDRFVEDRHRPAVFPAANAFNTGH